MKDFNYEIDAIFDLSSDMSETAPNLQSPLDLKSEMIFEEYDRQKRQRLSYAMLTSYLAALHLSPNGYLVHTCNMGSCVSPSALAPALQPYKDLYQGNFIELLTNRVLLQNSMNMASSRSFQAYLESSIDYANVKGGVIYQSATVNTLFLGLADTKYNREKYGKVNP